MPDTAFKARLALILIACVPAGGMVVSGHVSASPTLHKCVDITGRASYQSEPCAPDRRQAWAKEIEPDPPPRKPAARAAGQHDDNPDEPPAPRSQRRRSTSTGKGKGADGRKSPPSGSHAVGAHLGTTANSLSPQCQAARRRREQTLERVGLKRTYALLQKLDNAVQQACH